LTRIAVSDPMTRAADAKPMAMTRNGVPKPVAWAVSARTTRKADTTVR
jgi:hypothetical protein